MPDKTTSDFVLLIIKRKKNTLDGEFIEYLKKLTEIENNDLLKALMAFYLPFYWSHIGESGEEHKQKLIEIISDLESQIIKIKRLYNLEHLSQVVLINPPCLTGESATKTTSNFMSNVPVQHTKNNPVSFFETEAEDDEDDEDDDSIASILSKSNLNLDAGFRVD